MDFKQRVLAGIISGAAIFKDVLLDYDYLIYSPKFTIAPYYIISANKDNYVHLTGVHALIPAKDFFDKCYNGTVKETDFDFIKGNKSEKSIKGTVRKKITVLPFLTDLFSRGLQAEENFSKGRVHCFIATTDNRLTLGFVKAINAIPKSLLKDNQLDKSKAVPITLVLRRDKGAEKFDTVVQSNATRFCEEYPDIVDL